VDLVTEPWLLPTGTSVASLIADAFRASGVEPPRATVSARSPRLSDLLLASGRFLTVFPEAMMRLNAKNLPFKALPVALPIPPRAVAIVTLNNRTLSPIAKLVIDCMREVAKSLATKK
jgi:DNA-binding transcriptional LysR family regulator